MRSGSLRDNPVAGGREAALDKAAGRIDLVDWFTPQDIPDSNKNDIDLCAGPVLLPWGNLVGAWGKDRAFYIARVPTVRMVPLGLVRPEVAETRRGSVPGSEGTQKGDQVGLLLVCKPDVKSLVIKVDNIEQGGRPPLWKYGARDANPRRIGPLNLPISTQLPLIIARPMSVTWNG